MSVLVKWLGLDLNTIFGDRSNGSVSVPSDQQEVFDLINELNSTQLAILKNLISVGFLSKNKGQPSLVNALG